MKVVRIAGFILVALALVVSIVPPLYNCSSDGKMLTTTAGKQVPMKCFWTARASIGAALPLLLAGLLLGLGWKRDAAAPLAIVAIGAGAIIALLPTYLIGTCATYDMICNLVEKPTMLAAGILSVAAGAVALLSALRSEQAEAA